MLHVSIISKWQYIDHLRVRSNMWNNHIRTMILLRVFILAILLVCAADAQTGPKGAKGERGSDGADGIPGPKGNIFLLVLYSILV